MTKARVPVRTASGTTIGLMTNRPARMSASEASAKDTGQPSLNEVDDKERTAAAQGDGVHAVMQIEEIDGSVAEEGHTAHSNELRAFAHLP